MKKNLLTLLILFAVLIPGLSGCGDSPLTEAYNYVPNRAPVIDSLTVVDDFGTDLINEPADYLGSNNDIQITLAAYDPEGETLNIEFSSEFGSFSGKVTDAGITDVIFITNTNVRPDDPVSINIKLTDPAGMMTSRLQILGTGNSNLQISETTKGTQSPYTHVYNFTTPKTSDERTFEFTSKIAGIYQIRTDEPVFNRNEAVYLFEPALGDSITISVNDADYPLGIEGPHDIYIIFRDTIGNEAAFTKTVIADDTPPDSGTISFSTPKTRSDTAVPVIDPSDNMTPDEDMEMQISTSADFSGATWIKVVPEAGSQNTLSLGSTDGANTFYIRFKDGAGNISFDTTPSPPVLYTDSGTITRDTTAPGDPTAFSAQGLYRKVDLSWTNPGDSDLDIIAIVRNTSGTPKDIKDGDIIYLDNSPALNAAESHTDTDSLDNGKTYYYRIFALDDLENYNESTTVAASAIPQNNAPNVPTGLTNVSGTDEKIILTWNESTDPDGHNVTYIINISEDDSKYETLGESSNNVFSLNTAEIQTKYGANGTCYFRIRAIDELKLLSSSSSALDVAVTKFLPTGIHDTKSTVTDVKVNSRIATIAGYNGETSLEVIDVSSPDRLQLLHYSKEKNGIAVCESDSYYFVTRLVDTATKPPAESMAAVYSNKLTEEELVPLGTKSLSPLRKNLAWSAMTVSTSGALIAAYDGVYSATYTNDGEILETQNIIPGELNALDINLLQDNEKNNYIFVACSGYYDGNDKKYYNDGLRIYSGKAPYTYLDVYRDTKLAGISGGFQVDAFTAKPGLDDNILLYCGAREGGVSGVQYLYILNASKSTSPPSISLLGKVGVSGSSSTSPLDVCKLGNFAFMAAGTDGVRIFDVSEPESPVHLYTMPNITAYRIAVDEQTLYVAAGTGGLRLYNVKQIMETVKK